MAELSGRTKAAVVLVSLGSKYAANIYKHLTADEIRSLSLEVARLGDIADDVVYQVVKEFYSLCLANQVNAEGGLDYAKKMLEDAFGSKVADGYFRQVEEMMDSNSLNVIRNLDERSLKNVTQDEHPQTVAFILANAKPEQAAIVIAALPQDKRVAVVARMAKIDTIARDVLRNMEKLIERKLGEVMCGGGVDSSVDGVKHVADIMNSVDVALEKSLLEGIAQHDPQLGEEIIKRMFVFEDIVLLSGSDMQRVLRDVDRRDLALALKGANS
ncbi:MAG: flagellar motor switch protein FliG, partial [Oscillospiraceae bacterium]|nr:flagellar motor switch protein FliG [Oscillospiraceae bacterium]